MKTTYETYTFPSTDGVNHCSGIAFVPEGDVRALMVISHGMAEHMKRYLPVMQTFAGHGILCFGHDHIGHGATVTTDADLGYLPRRTGADTLISDVIRDAERFRGCYPDVPLILFGHSMGSFIARLAASGAHASLFDALILSGTGGKNPLAGCGMTMLRLLCAVRGERAYSNLMQSIMFDPYNARFEKRTPFDWLTSDPSVIDQYIADPHSGFPFTVSALFVLTSLLHSCNQAKTFAATPKELPILLISGRDDPVGDYGTGVHAVADAYREAGCRNVSHTLYTGARHELFNEPIAAEVTADLLHWIDTAINASPERSEPT